MDLGYALFKGALQGLTEFLPVSSTAHLLFTDDVLRHLGWLHPMLPGEEEFFDIVLHLGTLTAVLVYFWPDLTRMAQAIFSPTRRSTQVSRVDPLPPARVPKWVALSTVCTVGLILFFLKGSGWAMTSLKLATAEVSNLSDLYMHQPQLVAVHLMITGGLLYFTERYSQKQPGDGQILGIKHAVTIGLAQGMAAIFHGISRSGSTISAGLATGLNRETATRYAFLLSIPTFVMAAVYEFLKLSQLGHLHRLDWPVMLAGTVVSGISGYLCIRLFLAFVARHTLYGFSAYCVGMGLLMFVLFSTVLKA